MPAWTRVGENAILCAQTGIAGSSVLGNNVVLAGQVGVISIICGSATGPGHGAERGGPGRA